MLKFIEYGCYLYVSVSDVENLWEKCEIFRAKRINEQAQFIKQRFKFHETEIIVGLN